jgi:hypothetical protein
MLTGMTERDQNSFAATSTGWLEAPPKYRKAMFAELSRSLSL